MNAPITPPLPGSIGAPGVGATRYIGARVPRKEDPRLLTGRGQYVDDIVLPGMLHAAFLRSPIARGRIVSLDATVAREQPGVHAIYTAADLAAVPVQMMSFFLLPTEIPMSLLADGDVRYVGDPVALVIADNRYLAEDAAALIEVEYADEPPVVTIADAMRGAPVHPDAESNVAAAMGSDEPDEDIEAALAGAAHVVTQHVTHQRIAQSPMETRGVVVARDGLEMTIWITCQSPHMIARYVTMALGLPETSVRVIARDVGGSFGLKNHPWREEMATIVASQLIGRPLKWIEDRLEALTASNQAREQEMTLRIGFDANGCFLASHGDYSLNNGAYPQGADANVAVHMFIWGAYKMPAYAFHSRGWYSNTPGLAAYRGPWALESLVRETAMDKAARRMGIDPVEMRRRNLISLADQPMTTQFGIPLEDITPRECFDKLIDYLDIPAFRAEQAEARKQGRYLGIGFAAYIEPTGSSGGGMPVLTGELAQVKIDPTGRVSAVMSTHSQGHGTATTMAQCIADRLGVPYDDVTVYEGDSSRGGFGPGAAGSRQGVIGGGAAIRASEMLADKVKRVAAHLLNADVESISIADGMVHVAGVEEMSRSLKSIAEIAYGEPLRLPEGMEAGLEAQYRYTPPPVTFTSAAHACIVEVDAETGMVDIKRWISSEDCGTVINPAVVEGQIAGGLAQAIGTVLLEEVSFDAQGNPTAATFKDYLLPAISDVPKIEFVHASTPAKNIGGIRGVGEGGAIIGPPTLVNAIADALSTFGELDVRLPLTPSKLLGHIEGRDIAGTAHTAATPPANTADVETTVGAHGEGLPEVADVVLPGGAASEHNVSLDGDWAIVLATPMGPQEMVGRFAADAGVLTGTLTSPEGEQAFAGTIEGNRLRFDLQVTKPMKITLKYDVTVDGDSMTGKVKMGMFGTAKLTGNRT